MYVFHLSFVVLVQGLTSPRVGTGVSKCRDSRRLLTGMSSLRDWVVAAAAPRVAREDALEGKPTALEEAVFPDRLDAVVGAGGRVATALAKVG